MVAVHMPLFFIVSGYFINLDKIRKVEIVPFIKNKFTHLMIPAIIWTALYCILTTTTKGVLGFFTFYWYLFSYFVSFLIILLFCKLFSQNKMVIYFSILTVIFIPYSDIANLNFMFPFLWVGYLLKVNPPKRATPLFIISLIITIGLLSIWNWDYTVYLSRFNSAYMTIDMIAKYAIRFLMGISASYIIIWLAQRFENSKFIQKFSQYGQYTLITYLASLVLFGVITKYIYIGVEQPFLLELYSFVLCMATYTFCIYLQNKISKNKYARLLFLGN